MTQARGETEVEEENLRPFSALGDPRFRRG